MSARGVGGRAGAVICGRQISADLCIPFLPHQASPRNPLLAAAATAIPVPSAVHHANQTKPLPACNRTPLLYRFYSTAAIACTLWVTRV